MQRFTDQTGYSFQLANPPKSIISVVPSQTELLYDLGLDTEVAGITKFCVHPEKWYRQKPRVGGTRTLKIDQIRALNPDLVIANKEENNYDHVESLKKICPVWTSDIRNLRDALAMIRQVGKLTGKESSASKLAEGIENKFAALETAVSGKKVSKPEAAFLIWNNPYMAAGGDTFIGSMMEKCGLKNIFSNKKRYPQTTLQELKDLNCKLLLLSSEPFPFKEKHATHIQAGLPGIKTRLVDGEMFSWYGSRLQYAPGYFLRLREKLNLRGE